MNYSAKLYKPGEGIMNLSQEVVGKLKPTYSSMSGISCYDVECAKLLGVQWHMIDLLTRHKKYLVFATFDHGAPLNKYAHEACEALTKGAYPQINGPALIIQLEPGPHRKRS